MQPKLLEIVVCALCKGPLVHRALPDPELVCRACRIAYPVRDGIPHMLEEDARKLPADAEV